MSKLKPLLIVTYYWPPSGGSGVQRWLKFAKYLRKFGWEPIICTPENPEIPIRDNSLADEIPEGLTVIKLPIWEPYNLYRKFLGNKNEKVGIGLASDRKKDSPLKKLGLWIRGNFFVPDPRKFWVAPTAKFLTEYITQNGIGHVVTTGPPHSMHLIGLKLKQETDVRWIADFRDPWTGIYYYDKLMLSWLSNNQHRRLENQVLTAADMVLAVGPSLARELEDKGATKVRVVHNGFDRADYQERDSQNEVEKGFTLGYLGSFLATQNHDSLWQALKEFKAENAEFSNDLRILTVGQLDPVITDSLQRHGLQEDWTEIGYVSHDMIIQHQMECDVLLLMINNTQNAKLILTGKLFEYMATGKPIVCIGPRNCDAAAVLKATSSGWSFHFDDVAGIKKTVRDIYNGSIEFRPDEERVEDFSRERLTEKLSSLLNELPK